MQRVIVFLMLLALPAAASRAQAPASSAPANQAANEARERLAKETAADYADMQRQLGITAMRPGPSGNPSAPNAANSDEAKANPFTDIPDILATKRGARVTTAAAWTRRRTELLEDFSREVYGRVPRDVPRVTWREVRRVSMTVAGHPVLGRELVGHVDNRRAPAITVDITLMLVTPAAAAKAVPLVIMFRGGGLPGDPPPPLPPGFRPPTPQPGDDPPGTEQLIAAGWGYAFLNPSSVQADNGAGLTRGIIGLTNRGERRHPEDWGSLRAWAWGASRALDHLATDPSIDASRVAIEGVSRYGKAALVTMAFDTRFAMGLIASSGAGGAKLIRRTFGEAIENLTGSGEYHWFAGRYLIYGAAAPAGVAKTPVDLPVDSHSLIALCAPRRVFISHGIPEKGDAHWIDQRGAWMASLAAQPAWRLLGAKDLGVDRALAHRADARRQPEPARRRSRVAPARRRPHRRAQLEALHRMGRQVVSPLQAYARVALGLAMVCIAWAPSAPLAQEARTIAVTLDDGPFVGGGGDTYLAKAELGHDTTARCTASASGDGGAVRERASARGRRRRGGGGRRTALLRRWLDAGHASATTPTATRTPMRSRPTRTPDDIARGDRATRQLLAARGAPPPRYFRHPFTHTGDTAEKKAGIEAALAARGYVVTPHTMENADWLFNVGYRRAVDAGNAAETQRFAAAYLAHTREVVAFAEDASTRVFGRVIPQVLLIHANTLNARRAEHGAR